MMFGKNEEKALAKWPRQRRLRDGKAGSKLTGAYCPPECAMLAAGLVWVIAPIIMLSAGYYAAYVVPDQYEHHYFWPLMIGGLLVNYFLQKAGFYNWLLAFLFGPRLHMIIEPERIRVGSLFGYKNYPRNGLIIPIEVGPHKHTRKEQAKFRTGVLSRKQTPYYCDSVQVVMRYGEKRVILASLYDNQEKAESLALRIMGTQEALDRGFGV